MPSSPPKAPTAAYRTSRQAPETPRHTQRSSHFGCGVRPRGTEAAQPLALRLKSYGRGWRGAAPVRNRPPSLDQTSELPRLMRRAGSIMNKSIGVTGRRPDRLHRRGDDQLRDSSAIND